jgi:hypothetical protein
LTARELIRSVVITKQDKPGMLLVHPGANHRPEAILAQSFSLENRATDGKSKMVRFCSDHCGS